MAAALRKRPRGMAWGFSRPHQIRPVFPRQNKRTLFQRIAPAQVVRHAGILIIRHCLTLMHFDIHRSFGCRQHERQAPRSPQKPVKLRAGCNHLHCPLFVKTAPSLPSTILPADSALECSHVSFVFVFPICAYVSPSKPRPSGSRSATSLSVPATIT